MPIPLTGGAYSGLPASMLSRRWRDPEAKALFAGVAAHGFRPFPAPMSPAIGVTLGAAAHRWCWPAARDGSAAITSAMLSLLQQHGGSLETGARVTSLAQHLRSVEETVAYNANYVGGDVVTGANTPRQLLARPRLARDPYWLGVGGLYLCSAATPPGGGAHGMCGNNAARSALRRLGADAVPR